MSEIVSCCPLANAVSTCSTAAKHAKADSIDVWLERVNRLKAEDLTKLLPVLDAEDDVDVMRRLIRMCIILAHPERALANWLKKPADELMRWLYQVRTVADYLTAAERHEPPRAIALESWCLQVIDEYAQRDEESAERVSRWLARMLTKQHPAELCTQPAARSTTAPEAGGSAVPETIADQQTPTTERPRARAGSAAAAAAAANAAGNGAMS